MQKTFGEEGKLEVTVGVTYNWGRWGLPLALDIWWHRLLDISRTPSQDALNVDIAVDILCVRLFIEIWRWKNELKG